MRKILKNYSSILQNLRLIKRYKENRWREQNRMWSEAALGEDEQGNVLFMFSRSPYTMYDFNQELISLGVVAAQHLEGGPEAQLYINLPNHTYEMFGSYETSFVEDDSNDRTWSIPNVIGIRMKE